MYFNTQVLSVQNTDSLTFMSSSPFIILLSLVATTAADSSNLGIVIAFNGANRDLPIKKQQWMSPHWLSIRRYVTAPYPFWEASENVCSSHEVISPKSVGLKQRSITILSSSGSMSILPSMECIFRNLLVPSQIASTEVL